MNNFEVILVIYNYIIQNVYYTRQSLERERERDGDIGREKKREC